MPDDRKPQTSGISPYDPAAVAKVVRINLADTSLGRRGDAYDLSKPAVPLRSTDQRSK